MAEQLICNQQVIKDAQRKGRARMQKQNVTLPSETEEPKNELIPTKNKVRRVVLVLLLFLTVLFLILSLATRVRVKEDRAYTTKNEVALYLFTYKKLPSNYILKSSVPKSEQGRQPANGAYFGGDVFRNEGHIVDDHYTTKTDLRECDLSYPDDPSTRGLKRLVYSADCAEVFYTWTHYGDRGDPAFVKVTKWSINAPSNTFLILFIVLIVGETGYVCFVFIKKKENEGDDIRAAGVLFLKIAFYTVLSPLILVGILIYAAIESFKD
ncbi:MAG: hypothetical protein IKP74_08970 [Clostridia bacterium]|nr:hypothetical protein [Clostridia bacterium]